MYRKFETSEMSIKKIKHNTQVGGKINRPGQLAPTPATKVNETKQQRKQLNLTVIMIINKSTNIQIRIFKTSEMSMKKFNSHYRGGGVGGGGGCGGGKIIRPGQLAPSPATKGMRPNDKENSSI